ncbi:ABC transporter ATP-binding protein [Oricola cellulosilytica]|uniref:ABC transporter ATP-binding protein n=1 Tax=Oricola cellulosilytica TaxID=1429082 RepID=A0A4R0PBN0_9HYPH|nr:ABC transporter ATP-binding protein [Oricola cellulosilytica]TCD12347.1 ABC transporter ATP-binding protein [Oricola cellulosilytica]
MAQAQTPSFPRTGVSFAAELAFEDIHLHYGAVHTLKGISLVANPGEILCLLGPSGSGKTSLLRLAAGLEAQTSGRVTMNGQLIAGPATFLPPEERSVGLMFQDFALFPHMSILDNVRFGLHDMKPADAHREAMAAIRRVGLEHHARSFPHVLSGGEQQRVALARALAPRPSVILMDEPFSGLDTRLKDSVRAETLAILRETRATAIVVTHDAEEAMRMGDRIALLNRGEIVQSGTAQEIYHGPQSLFVAGFFAELNVFDATSHKGVAETPIGAFDCRGYPDGSSLKVAIRTVGLNVRANGDVLPSGHIPGRIVSRRFLGSTEALVLAVPGTDQRVRARIRADELPPGVKDVVINVRKRDIMLFESDDESA